MAEKLVQICGIVGVAAVTSLAVSGLLARAPDQAATDLTPPSLSPCTDYTARDGYLQGRLYGGVDLEVNWHAEHFRCGGFARPDRTGVRLFFARELENNRRLMMIVGIDSVADPVNGNERPVNVTVIDERNGGFYSSAGSDRCWTSVKSFDSAADRPGASPWIRGEIYCAGALPSLKDRGTVTLGDFSYFVPVQSIVDE